jgi:hypothetical protein
VVITNHRLGTGHGNHQAMAQLIAEAIPKAASPDVFPQQITEEGLAPWQVRRLFQKARHHEGVSGEAFDVSLPVGGTDPVRGLTFQEMASEALLRHRSQGVKGVWERVNRTRKESAWNFFELLKGDAPKRPMSDLFKGLPGAWWTETGGWLYPAASGSNDDGSTVEKSVAQWLGEAFAELFSDPGRAEKDIAEAIDSLAALPAEIDSATHWTGLPKTPFREGEAEPGEEVLARYKDEVIDPMLAAGEQQKNLEGLLGMMWGLDLGIEAPEGPAAPGAEFPLSVILSNRASAPVAVETFELTLPPGWKSRAIKTDPGPLPPLAVAEAHYRVFPPDHEEPTLPATRELYRFDQPWLPNIRATALVSKEGREGRIEATHRVEVSPKWEVFIEPRTVLVRKDSSAETVFRVKTQCHTIGDSTATLVLSFPDGSTHETVLGPGAAQDASIPWKPLPSLVPGSYKVESRLSARSGVYQAAAKVAVADVKVSAHLTVGVVQSYDTTLPDALETLGIMHSQLAESDLRGGELKRFDTILVDIRGYLERPDLREWNSRLLHYAKEGGHLVVFYHKTFEWNDATPPYAPFLLQLSGNRVTEEDSPVTLLKPDHPLFNLPNKIDPNDWTGWIQERGLYFPGTYDSAYEELVSMADTGSAPLKGGILWAGDGGGTYVYTCLSWYRELRAGVPGAYRLFANLVSYPEATKGTGTH